MVVCSFYFAARVHIRLIFIAEKGTSRRNKFLLEDDPDTMPEVEPETTPKASSSQTVSTGVASSQRSAQPSRSQGSQEPPAQPSTSEGPTPQSPMPAPPVTPQAVTIEAAQPPPLPTPGSVGAVELSQVPINPSQLSVSTPQVVTQPHVVVEPPQPIPDPVTSQAGALSVNPQSSLTTNATSSATTPKTRYRVWNPTTTPSTAPSRRDSIIGAPEMIVDTADGGQDIIVDLTGLISFEGDDLVSHVSSSQKTADGSRELSPPPAESQQSRPTADQSAPIRTLPQLDVDKEDLPTWMVKKGQWKYVTSTAGGTTWENLLRVYMIQERRLEFTEMVSNLVHIFSTHIPDLYPGYDTHGRGSAIEDQGVFPVRPPTLSGRHPHPPRFRHGGHPMVEEYPTGMASLQQRYTPDPGPVVLHPFWRVEGRIPVNHVSSLVGSCLRTAKDL